MTKQCCKMFQSKSCNFRQVTDSQDQKKSGQRSHELSVTEKDVPPCFRLV
jgi:hypothetical protein